MSDVRPCEICGDPETGIFTAGEFSRKRVLCLKCYDRLVEELLALDDDEPAGKAYRIAAAIGKNNAWFSQVEQFSKTVSEENKKLCEENKRLRDELAARPACQCKGGCQCHDAADSAPAAPDELTVPAPDPAPDPAPASAPDPQATITVTAQPPPAEELLPPHLRPRKKKKAMMPGFPNFLD